jgi:glycosyltransferase involved in cell wall biosynthesis
VVRSICRRVPGYGAAIKCGFEYGRGDLVSFLDADAIASRTAPLGTPGLDA